MKDALLILDWGIGGLGTFIEVRRRNPDIDILYWSDSGATPYGKMSQDELSKRVLSILEKAQALGASQAIVACNAASTILPFIQTPIPTLGVIEEGIDRLIRTKTNGQTHLGVIGGKRTIESEAWAKPLNDAGFRVSAKVAQPLSALIEAGQHHSPEALPVFKSVLSGLEKVDILVLACTHYVAASELIESILRGVTLFDPVQATVDYAFENWSLSGDGLSRFLTSGEIRTMERSAKLAYELDIRGQIEKVPQK